MKTAREVSELIIDAIIRDLSDRAGLSNEWEQIDEDIRTQIRANWIETSRRILIDG